MCNVSIYLSFPRDASDSSSTVCSAMGCHAKDPKAMCGDTMSFMYGQPAVCSRAVLCVVLSCLSMFIYVLHGHEHEACIMMQWYVMMMSWCNLHFHRAHWPEPLPSRSTAVWELGEMSKHVQTAQARKYGTLIILVWNACTQASLPTPRWGWHDVWPLHAGLWAIYMRCWKRRLQYQSIGTIIFICRNC